MKTKILLLAFFLTSTFANASHLMGGEITWTCLGTGQYIFHLKVYRDCNGNIFYPAGIYLNVHNKPGLDTINMNLVSQTDLSPRCDSLSGPQISCATASGVAPGAIEEFVFESNPITLNGIPPANGWIFSYNNCCRSSAISNIQYSSAQGIALRAIMYPFNGQNAGPCYDSSPTFAESPKAITCSGYSYSYNPVATDNELDSLVYSWAKPLDRWSGGTWSATNPLPISFNTGYAFDNPLPDTSQNANNVPAVLNPATGDMCITSYTSGSYTTVVSVAAFKCGLKVAEIFRDMQFNIINCVGSNNLPNVSSTLDSNIATCDYYRDTVFAGDSISFAMMVSDFDTSFTGIPQYITTSAKGLQFGLNLNQTDTGCRIPPCAVIVQPMPHVAYSSDTINFGWQTTTDHLGLGYVCAYMPNTHYFNFVFTDSKCSVPGSVSKMVAITVLPTIPKPAITFDGTTLSCDSGFSDYQWYKNRFKISGATSQTYNPTAKALYECRVLDSLFKGNYSFGFNVTSFTAIEDYKESTVSLNIYPNPVTNEFVIGNTEVLNHGNYTVNLFDVYGKKVLTTENQNKIAVEKLATGIYVVELRTKNMVVRNRIIKNGK